MAPNKRSAASSPPRAKRNSGAKKPKVVEDPFLESLEPILSLLRESENTTEAAENMFEAALPFALRSPKSERHAFQANLVDAVRDLLHKVETSKKEAVQEEESNLTKVEAEIAANAAAVNDMTSKQTACTQHQQDADTSMKEAQEALNAARVAHTTAVKIAAGLEEEHARTLAEKTERDKFMDETWVQLKTCTSHPGRLWRERNKLIDNLIELLAKRQTEVSCMEALKVALKEKPEQRGAIGTKSIEHVEKQLLASVQEFVAKIEGHVGDVAEKTQATEEAVAKVKAAENALVEKEDLAIEAENALLEASEAFKACNKDSKQLGARALKLVSTIETVKAAHGEAKSVVATLENIIEHGETTTPSAALEEGDDAVMASVEPVLEAAQAAIESEA